MQQHSLKHLRPLSCFKTLPRCRRGRIAVCAAFTITQRNRGEPQRQMPRRKGLALMPYWTGSITTNRLRFEFLGK
jgi:hypothetical protein